MSTRAVADTSATRSVRVSSLVGGLDRTTAAVVGITAVAGVLRFWRIGHQSFWYDESFTVVLVHHSPITMLRLLPRTELTPPVYYSLAWIWAHIFGYSEAALRSLSALAGVATIPAIYAAAAKLISRRAGLTAAALAACNPFLIWYSQEARSYALLVLWVSLSLLAFAHARLPRPPTRWLVAWSLIAGLTVATHYFGVLAVVPQAIWLLWIHRRDWRMPVAVAVAAALGAAFLPFALSQRPQASWIERFPLDKRLSQIAPQFLLGTGAPARTVLKLAGAAAVGVAIALLAWRAGADERRGAMWAAALGLAGFALSLILIVAGVDELITRNVIAVLVPLIVFLAAGLGARRAGLLGAAGAATLCAIGIVGAIAVAVDRNFERPNWRGLVHAIGIQPVGSGRAVLLQNDIFLMPLPVDMPGVRFMKGPGARVNELDVIAVHGPGLGWFCWWGSLCNLKTSPLDTSIRVPGFHRVGPVLNVDRFRVLRLRSATPIRLTPRRVAHALGTARNQPYALLVQPGR